MPYDPAARITYKIYTPALGVAWNPPEDEEIISEQVLWIGGLLGGSSLLLVATKKVTFV